jgi:hypothetical protein
MDGNTAIRVRSHLRTILLLSIVLLSTGCFSSSNKLTFRSNHGNEIYPQAFRQAYYSKTEDGRYDVVLMEGGQPLNQIVHIKVLWKPLRGVKPDAPSATNSVIDWYLQSGGDRLHYRGAGFVSVSEGRSDATFVIRNAQVELSEGSGRLHDPLGASSLSGSFDAVPNPGQVSSTIEMLRQENARSQVRQASAIDGPPPRTPVP